MRLTCREAAGVPLRVVWRVSVDMGVQCPPLHPLSLLQRRLRPRGVGSSGLRPLPQQLPERRVQPCPAPFSVTGSTHKDGARRGEEGSCELPGEIFPYRGPVVLTSV